MGCEMVLTTSDRAIHQSARNGLYRRLLEEVRAAGLSVGPGDHTTVAEADLAGLPPTARRYLRFAGVVGRPRVWSFRLGCEGRFRMRPDMEWMPAEAWQYNTGVDMARIFVMRVRMAGLPMVGRDIYVDGHGHMEGKLLGLVKVVSGHGDEFDTRDLTTFLNDALLFAPSMLLRPEVTWSAVDDRSFDVALTHAGRTVHGRLFVDERGEPHDFVTTDRYAALPGGPVRAEWRTPIERWEMVDGRSVPGNVSSIWHLPEGPFPYLTAYMTDIAFNVDPLG